MADTQNLQAKKGSISNIPHIGIHCFTLPAQCLPLKLRMIRKQARIGSVEGFSFSKQKLKRGKQDNVGETMEAATFCSHQWLSRSPWIPWYAMAATWQHET